MTQSSNLLKHHYDDLANSGLDDETISKMEARSITVREAIQLGFGATSTLKETGETISLLDPKYVQDCLLLALYNRDGKPRYDEKTGSLIAVLKIFYQTGTLELLKEKLPKYLCLSKTQQTKQSVHFPRNFDWKGFIEKVKADPNIEYDIQITEGIKKAEKACQERIPCLAVWSIFCFSENGLDTSPLIEDLKELAMIKNLNFNIVFDSDKYLKPQVLQAETMFANKLKAETGKMAYKVNLPQRFNGTITKGLDDFLTIASPEEFKKLPKEKVTSAFINSFELIDQVPQAPLDALPEIFLEAIQDISTKLEGSLELAAMALIGSVIGPSYNVISCQGAMLNMFLIGLSPTTTGKTAIVRECFRPSLEIHKVRNGG
jgi:hypothetical protein